LNDRPVAGIPIAPPELAGESPAEMTYGQVMIRNGSIDQLAILAPPGR
jgi:hypothetical protein